MTGIAERVADHHAGWPGPFVEDDVLGTHDPGAVAAALEGFCRAQLGARVVACAFYEASVGLVAGVEFADGRRIAVKAHRPGVDANHLLAAHRVQAALAERGFPCPRPVCPPHPLGRGLATAEELLDEGDRRDAHDPEIRRAMAGNLARLVALAEDLRSTSGLRRGFLSRPDALRELWPEPHSRLFDFRGTATGAEWIDEHARRARAVLSEVARGRPVVGHIDWSVKHFRFVGSRARVIYDWDSLRLEPEPAIVGEAARGFTMTWYLDVAVIPSVEEARAFVAEYEEARGRRFGSAERRQLGAAAAYALAYTARCEACLDGAAGDFPPGSARHALAVDGDEWLAL